MVDSRQVVSLQRLMGAGCLLDEEECILDRTDATLEQLQIEGRLQLDLCEERKGLPGVKHPKNQVAFRCLGYLSYFKYYYVCDVWHYLLVPCLARIWFGH